MISGFSYVRATSVEDAVGQLAAPTAFVHAGGTDLLGCLRDRVFEAERIVSISRIEDLKGISKTADGGLRIGALTTLGEIAADPTIVAKYSTLAQAAANVGSPQLRNQGTLGGNLCQRPRCWYFRGPFQCAKKGGDLCYAVDGENEFHCIFGGGPCYIVHPSDTAPALAGLGAQLRIAGPDGTRVLPVDRFFQLPEDNLHGENVLRSGEIVTQILLPSLSGDVRSSFHKLRVRQAWDFALASAAAVVAVKEGVVEWARIFLGGVAPVPWRALEAEKTLDGKNLDEAAMAAASEAAIAGASSLEKNAYKLELVKGVVLEALSEL